MNKALILFIGVFFLFSCSKEDPIGEWDDNIKLSAKNVDFKSTADSVLITTKGDWWWIDGISFEDSTYSYYNREGINLETNAWSIKEASFTLERRDKNTLFVKLNENKTGKERSMTIVLQAGNYFDSVKINQVAN